MATGVSSKRWKNQKPLPVSGETSLEQDLAVTLSYAGKESADRILAMAPANVKRLFGLNSEYSNSLFYGDNLSILALLAREPSIKGKVKLIYIDPPFATKSVFQSRNQKDAYSDLLSGATFLEFLRKRLIFLKQLLSEDGSIYVHLDSNMVFHVKLLMDEIFGTANFRSFITRKKCNPKNYTRKSYGNVSDYLLFYSKSDNYVWNRAIEPWGEEKTPKEYRYIEKDTGRAYMKVPVHAPGVRNGETGKTWRDMMPPPGKHWQYTPTTLDEMDARGEIYWSPNGNPRRKVYLDTNQGIPVQDIWLEFKDAHNQNIRITGYPTEKNHDLLARIINASSNPGDLVLDCFSGSGTTLAVAAELGRRWIGVDNSSEAITTTLHRLVNGLERMGDYVGRKKVQITNEAFHSEHKTNANIEALPLFPDNIGDPRPKKRSRKDSEHISAPSLVADFNLWAVQPYQGEIDDAVEILERLEKT